MALCTLPAALSALPSASSFVSPVHFAGRFLHSAFGLLNCALDSILIHLFLLFIDNLYTGDAAAFIYQQAEDGS